MKKRIFTPSITIIRGERLLANKAGIFRLDRSFCSYTATCTCRSWVVMAPESRLERVVIDSGKGRSLSVCPQTSITTMYKEIITTNGKVVIVDPDDYDRLNKRKWVAHFYKGAWYAVTLSRINGRVHRMHRMILQPQEKMTVDHINGNTLDNRRVNLRICTFAENQRNKGVRKDNKTGYKGVWWYEKRKKFRAQIFLNRRGKTIGYFSTAEEAARAYDAAARELHGEFANTNFPITG